MKCLCYFETLVELIKAFDFKKELEGGIFLSYNSLLQLGKEMEQKSVYYARYIFRKWQDC